jgi:hypothetical protein
VLAERHIADSFTLARRHPRYALVEAVAVHTHVSAPVYRIARADATPLQSLPHAAPSAPLLPLWPGRDFAPRTACLAYGSEAAHSAARFHGGGWRFPWVASVPASRFHGGGWGARWHILSLRGSTPNAHRHSRRLYQRSRASMAGAGARASTAGVEARACT